MSPSVPSPGQDTSAPAPDPTSEGSRDAKLSLCASLHETSLRTGKPINSHQSLDGAASPQHTQEILCVFVKLDFLLQ